MMKFTNKVFIHLASLMSDTDCDIANALYHLYNSNFVCASVSHDHGMNLNRINGKKLTWVILCVI